MGGKCMKPLYVKKNGVVYKISGTGMPSIYPAANVEYDNTATSELQATDVQGAIDELSTRQGGVQSDWNENDTTELDYIKNKPENLVQDASYVHTDNNYDATAKGKVDSLGTASTKNVGVANGVAELDAAGKVPSSQLPSFVDDVIEVADYDHLPITGESGKIYVTLDTNKTYRWTGSGYAEISESLALGETSSTAYRGDRGKTAYNHATETKLSTATTSGLYKVAATAQGHISSLTAVTKEDITGLGIPGQDTIIKNTAYGTCDTAGDVKDKVATLSNATNWLLEVGTIVGVRFTYTNTYTPSSGNNVTLNVNNTGAKNIRYSDGIVTSSTIDAKNPTAFGEAGQTIYYMYDGTYWVWVSHSKDNDTLYNFKGNEFRSADGNNYGQEPGYGGNANYMVVNGHYYYNSNGPSTDIGASANDGAIYVQGLDEDNVTQIAQNYENGNIFVRSKVNGSWTEWKKTIANITANNTVLTTDKTPFLTRQTLNPTGFSGYVREKLVGASYAWNQLCENGDFSNGTQGWTLISFSSSVSSNICTLTLTATGDNYADRVCYQGIAGHKYLVVAKVKPSSSNKGSFALRTYYNGTGNYADYVFQNNNTWQFGMIIIAETTGGLNNRIRIRDGSYNQVAPVVGDNANVTCCMVIDLTLAFGSTIADYLYSLTNNGGITKLRDMGFPVDKYTPYGYGLYSVKTSGKKIYGYNLLGNTPYGGGYYNAPIGTDLKNTSNVISYTRTNDEIVVDITGAWNGHTFATPVLPVGHYKFAANFSSLTSGVLVRATLYITTEDYIVKAIDYNFQYNGNNHRQDIELTEPSRLVLWIGANNPTKITAYHPIIAIKNLSRDYEGYMETTYLLGNDELRGKFDLVDGEIVASGDVKESNGEITRKYGIVDLGTLTWEKNTASGDWTYPTYFRITTAISNIKEPLSTSYYPNIICAKYRAIDAMAVDNLNNDMVISVYLNKIAIVDSSKVSLTAEQFKTAMSGIYAVYELATPTTEQSTPFADPMSLVGATTEEYIDTRDIPCPVGAERQYMGQSEDVVEIPSSPQSDGKRILISEVSGGKEQVYWDSLTKLNYRDYTVKGNGTTTWGDLLSSLRPIYESLSEDEKTFSKLIFRPESISGNECLSYCGAYWYSRMGLNSNKTLWIDHASLGPSSSDIYYYQKNGDTFIDKTSQTTTYSLSLRVFVEVGNNS